MAESNKSPTAPATQDPSAAITTPFWDGFLSGGFSLVAMVSLLVYELAFGGASSFQAGDWIALTILINTPHFMASYRVLYVSREQIAAHQWATIFVPLMLVSVIVLCASVDQPGPILHWLILANSIYLAWHYAGQTWGMVASFSHMAGLQYTPRERFLLRAGPRALLTLHVLFALTGRFPPSAWIDPKTYVSGFTMVTQLVLVIIGLTIGLGAWAFYSARARSGRLPLRVVLPWAALYVWYPFWYFVPGGFFFVQLAHALQYLAFPLRIEVNRYAAQAPRTSAQKKIRAGAVYIGLVLVGAVILHGPPLATHALGQGWYSTGTIRMILVALTSCVGIHHYFVDGAIWRLRNPEVRRQLFSHLPERPA